MFLPGYVGRDFLCITFRIFNLAVSLDLKFTLRQFNTLITSTYILSKNSLMKNRKKKERREEVHINASFNFSTNSSHFTSPSDAAV